MGLLCSCFAALKPTYASNNLISTSHTTPSSHHTPPTHHPHRPTQKFKRGGVDEFEIEAPDVGGRVAQLEVGHDGGGAGGGAPSWLLSHVEVIHRGTGAAARFNAGTWLDAAAGAARVALNAAADEAAVSTPPRGLGAGAAPPLAAPGERYKLSVQTLDARGAGTHSAISVVLVGENGASAELLLERAGPETFSRGRVRTATSLSSPSLSADPLISCLPWPSTHTLPPSK